MIPVLLTGPGGRIGSEIVPMLCERYDLRTYDLQDDASNPQHFQGDLQDIEVLKTAMSGCQAVIHLAATSDEAPFHEQLLPNNLAGVYNVLEAAHQSDVKRVIFASSVQAVGHAMRRDGPPFEAHELARPSTVYGATKIWGETLGRYYFDKHGLEFVSLRIGAFQPYNSDWLKKDIARDIWLSPRDMFQLLWRAIETPDIGYAIVHATSQTPREKMSLKEARELLGYVPEDNADDFYSKRNN